MVVITWELKIKITCYDYTFNWTLRQYVIITHATERVDDMLWLHKKLMWPCSKKRFHTRELRCGKCPSPWLHIGESLTPVDAHPFQGSCDTHADYTFNQWPSLSFCNQGQTLNLLSLSAAIIITTKKMFPASKDEDSLLPEEEPSYVGGLGGSPLFHKPLLSTSGCARIDLMKGASSKHTLVQCQYMGGWSWSGSWVHAIPNQNKQPRNSTSNLRDSRQLAATWPG